MAEKKKKYQRKDWIGCDLEKHYFGDDKKISKEDRKRLQAKDRSKYKKSDIDKYEQQLNVELANKADTENLLTGRVLSISGLGIAIEEQDGHLLYCTLRGVLKKERTHMKNLVTVGDFVLYEKISDDEGVIGFIKPRKSVLSRADNLSRKKEQLIAANIDQVLITVSVVNPPLKPFLVDRYVIAARKGGMLPVIVVNKVDLLSDHEEERALYDAFITAYSQAGLTLISVSAETGEGMDELRHQMKGKASVFSGQSGVGKSSLINEITGLDLKVGETVQKTRKGSHTTTAAELVPLDFGGWCIDTPGIKSFGVWDLDVAEAQEYFPDIMRFSEACKFPDCSHFHEGQCGVKAAVEAGNLHPLRYDSYQFLIDSITEEHKRR
ncbi:MAG: ribosome small subunit-dependent GTPase A [Chlamydiales bacterium]|nr:ribosome small subunit-dependent GTPase A [Chlamydiia bacterium]MCP5507994.1 ribosome small subunit-dependent GTPase A [Chlamydiales bacterium]